MSVLKSLEDPGFDELVELEKYLDPDKFKFVDTFFRERMEKYRIPVEDNWYKNVFVGVIKNYGNKSILSRNIYDFIKNRIYLYERELDDLYDFKIFAESIAHEKVHERDRNSIDAQKYIDTLDFKEVVKRQEQFKLIEPKLNEIAKDEAKVHKLVEKFTKKRTEHTNYWWVTELGAYTICMDASDPIEAFLPLSNQGLIRYAVRDGIDLRPTEENKEIVYQIIATKNYPKVFRKLGEEYFPSFIICFKVKG